MFEVSSVASNAVAVIGPTPGTVPSLRITGFSSAIAAMRSSAVLISAVAVRIPLQPLGRLSWKTSV